MNTLIEVVNRLSLSNADKAVVTFAVSGTPLTFQMDMRSKCNVLPFDLYNQITGDRRCRKLKSGHTLVQHNLQEEKAKGKIMVQIERNEKKATLLFQIVQGPVQPILSLATSERLGLVRIMASDIICHVVDTDSLVEQDPIFKEYQDVFTGLGKVSGKHHIHVDETVKPDVHVPRKIPVAFRDKLEMELTQLENEGVTAKVVEPIPWVSSLIIVPKPNGKLRICIDQRDLNKAIQREHYPSKTVEEIATLLPKARVFSVLDAKSSFHQIVLDRASSMHTAFNTLFGRYCWKRMPFGIKSAIEVWQRTVNEIIKGLQGVKVIADDFLVIGFGEDDAKATKSHDEHPRKLIERLRQANLKLNGTKIHLRKKSVHIWATY